MNPNDPAFPKIEGLATNEYFNIANCGLTKRELFAAIAMQGLIAGCFAGNNAGFTTKGNCVASVEYSDALIKELKEKE